MIERERNETMVTAGAWKYVVKGRRQELSLETGALIPAAQVALIAGAAGLSATIIFGLASRDIVTGIVAGGVAVGVALLPSAVGLISWHNIRAVAWEQYDAVSKNEASANHEHATLTIHTVSDGGRVHLRDRLPVELELFTQWAEAVAGGASLSTSQWTGSAGAFSRSEYSALCDWALKAGVIAWANAKNKRAGYALTTGGRHTLKRTLGNLQKNLEIEG